MEKYELQKLIDLPIEGVAQRLGLKVTRHKSLCPFHDDKRPSLAYNVTKNRYRCYVCGAYGRTIDLVMNFLHLGFFDACKWLANENNIILTEYKSKDSLNAKHSTLYDLRSTLYEEHLAQLVAQPVLTDEARYFLYEQRKLNPRVIDWCKISSTNTHLLIPYFDINNKLLSVQWRYLGTDTKEPRFRFPKGSQCGIYNLQVVSLLKENEPLFITEGCSDCWAMLSSGHKAIAIPSATLLKPQDLDTIRYTLNAKHSTLHMYPDNDDPGERLFLQLRELLPQIVRHQLPTGCKDYSEAYLSNISNHSNYSNT